MILESPPRRQPRQNERANATSDRAAAQASRMLAAVRPAAGLEPRVGAGLEPRAAGGRGRPAAEAQGARESPAAEAPGARESQAAPDEAREAAAAPARALPQEPDEAPMALA